MPRGVWLAWLWVGVLFSGSLQAATGLQPVSVSRVKELAIYPEISIPATSLSLNQSVISSQVGAVVKHISANVGDVVEEGDILLQFDAADYRYALQRAEAALAANEAKIELAEFDLEQTRILSAEAAVSQQNLRQRQAELKALHAEQEGLRAALGLAKLDLKRCVVRAPFKAVVTDRSAKLGELAAPGKALFELADLSRIEVSAKLQASDVARLSSNDRFQFLANDKSYPVKLRVVTPAFDPVERSREARFTYVAKRALPGVAGTLVWRLQQPHLPADLLLRRNGKLGVFVVKENRAHFVELPMAREGRPVKLNMPLNAEIITEGRFVLQHGTPVQVQ